MKYLWKVGVSSSIRGNTNIQNCDVVGHILGVKFAAEDFNFL